VSQTHDLAEWLAFLSLGIGVHGAFSAPYFLLVDATARDFDPRPAVSRAIESGRYDQLLCAVANAKHDTHRAAEALALAALNVRDRARLAVIDALLAALRHLSPKGTTR
jgi:hypothetical protein